MTLDDVNQSNHLLMRAYGLLILSLDCGDIRMDFQVDLLTNAAQNAFNFT